MPAHKARANRNWGALLVEKEVRDSIRDGTGLRYRIGPDYVLADEPYKAERYFDWFCREFPDDTGEPIHLLYRAIERFNRNDIEAASRHLKDAMLSNLYLLPQLIKQPIARLDIWHGSNWHEPEYLQEVAEYLTQPTSEQREWMHERYETASFRELRTEYIRAHKVLLAERDIARRGHVLDKLATFVAANRSSPVRVMAKELRNNNLNTLSFDPTIRGWIKRHSSKPSSRSCRIA